LGQHIWVRKRHLGKEGDAPVCQRAQEVEADEAQTKELRQDECRSAGQGGDSPRDQYKTDISIERLSRFRPKGRKFNKKVKKIPFALFRRILEGRCFDNRIVLNRVDAYHTSKWCSRCGAVGRGHDGRNYALFRCNNCGLTVNADRKASLAVAVKTLLERNNAPNQNTFQISNRRVPVSGLLRTSPIIRGRVAVPMPALERGKRPV
jgi:transposase